MLALKTNFDQAIKETFYDVASLFEHPKVVEETRAFFSF